MTARPTMAHLIAHVRRLVNDAGTLYTDDEVQTALDVHREDVVREPLTAVPRYRDGAVEYLRYTSKRGFWESNAEVQTAAGASLVPAEVDWLAGVFVFSASQAPPLFIHGARYDVYAAAADLLEQYAATLDATDFSLGGDSVSQSKQVEAVLTLADRYRRQAWSAFGTGVLWRDDAVA